MTAIDRRTVRIGLAIASLASFAAAYAFPAIGTCSRDPAGTINWFGNDTVLVFGWLGILGLQIGWFANLALGRALLALIRGSPPTRRLLVVHAGTFVVGCLTLQPALGFRLWHNEAWSEPICRLGPGFWLWALAHVVAVGGVTFISPGKAAKERL